MSIVSRDLVDRSRTVDVSSTAVVVSRSPFSPLEGVCRHLRRILPPYGPAPNTARFRAWAGRSSKSNGSGRVDSRASSPATFGVCLRIPCLGFPSKSGSLENVTGDPNRMFEGKPNKCDKIHGRCMKRSSNHDRAEVGRLMSGRAYGDCLLLVCIDGALKERSMSQIMARCGIQESGRRASEFGAAASSHCTSALRCRESWQVTATRPR